MILDRLLVPEKLNLLVMIPMVMVVLLMVPLVISQVRDARVARATSVVAGDALRVSTLVEEVQAARLLSVAYLDTKLVSSSQVRQRFEAVAAARQEALDGLGPSSPPRLEAALNALGPVSVLMNEKAVLGGWAPDQTLISSLDFAVVNLLNALELPSQPAATPADAQAMTALDTLLRADEAASTAGAMMLAAAGNVAVRDGALATAAIAQGVEADRAAEFLRLASPDAQNLFFSATRGESGQRLEDAYAEVGLAGATLSQVGAQRVLSAVQTETTLRQMVAGTVARTVSSRATGTAQSSLLSAAGLSGAGLALLGLVVWLSIAVGRSVSVPLRRLTTAAGSVADLTEGELRRVADEDSGGEAVPHLPAIAVRTRDEIGDLGAAFNRVQSAAGQLLERQIASRRNVAAMFASVGRRTSNLIGRQLALIDQLERTEEDADTLRTLYRLDHVSTRLRRNSSSLIVLSGGGEMQGEGWPLPLPDAIRAALGSVEDFQRVKLTGVPDLHLAPAVVSDLVLLLAELIENSVLFSPPHAPVEVSAWVTEDAGCAVMIVDQGIGMPAERLAEENERLRQRERLDLAPTDVLGLFVVGRIARRHGLDVTLMPTPGRGVTARVLLPTNVFVDRPLSFVSPPSPAGSDAAADRPRATRVITNRIPFTHNPATGIGRAPSAPQRALPAAPPLPSRTSGAPSEPQPIPVARQAPGAKQPPALPRSAPAARSSRPAAQPPAAPPAAAPGSGPAVPGTEGELRRRVPGEHWAAQSGGAPPAGAVSRGDPASGEPRHRDPEAARRELEDLEAAVARAHTVPDSLLVPDARPAPADDRPGGSSNGTSPPESSRAAAQPDIWGPPTPQPPVAAPPPGAQPPNGTGTTRPQVSPQAPAAPGNGSPDPLPRRVPQANAPWAVEGASLAAPPSWAAPTAARPPAAAPSPARPVHHPVAPGRPQEAPLPQRSAPAESPPRRVPHADAPWRPEPTAPEPMPRLMRRVPGATLASLEAAAPTAQPRSHGRAGIDAEETLQSILDIDAAVERARSTAVSRDGGRSADGGGSVRRIRWGDDDGGQG